MSRFKPNMEAVRRFMGPWAQREVSRWDRGVVGDLIRGGEGHIFRYAVDLETGAASRHSPTRNGHIDVVMIDYVRNSADGRTAVVDYSISFPLAWLTDVPPKYVLYRATFFGYGNVYFGPSWAPFYAGYHGITSRSPITRIREHYADAVSGRGHVFHSAWRHVLENPMFGTGGRRRAALFALDQCADTLDNIYEMEERAVARETLVPMGLNAIPGGRAGLREMWRLGMLAKQNATPDERDAAMVDLEEGRGPVSVHYRRGHMRTLPAGSKKRTTWVSPCIVGLNAGSVLA